MRLVLGGADLAAGFTTTGVPDEWVGLVVPGQFQSRYYTVRSWSGGELVLDVVLHPEGLVTEWARRDVVGERVTVMPPKGSFTLPVRRTLGATGRRPDGACRRWPGSRESLADRVSDGLDLHVHAEVPGRAARLPPARSARDLDRPVRAPGWPTW